MGDGILGTCLDAETAEDTSSVVNVVNLRIAFVTPNPLGIRTRVVDRLDVYAIRRASRRAEVAGNTFFFAILIDMQ